MKNPIPQLLLLLAASDASRNEIMRLFTLIEQRGAQAASDMVSELRAQARKFDDVRLGRPSQRVRQGDHAKVSRSKLGERVEGLLLLETNLTKGAAVDLLTEMLTSQGRPASTLPSANKISFREWVERLAAKIDPKELLSAASVIRNRVVHGGRLDWPLRRGDA